MSGKVVLVTGGAGYIGSHAVLALISAGHRVVVVDDLSTGHRHLVPDDVPFFQENIGDKAPMADILQRTQPHAVMHFAGSIVVPESTVDPTKYFENNTVNSLRLIEACIESGISKVIFSSTAAVYGLPETSPVAETSPTRPINPYGRSKLMVETMLEDVHDAHGLDSVSLRYFNVAGADEAGRSGQIVRASTHLIKVACETAVGLRDFVEIYGEDYDTPDGTCIRDYIHVSDLAEAHVAALAYLEDTPGSARFNCGYGRGHSVREVLDLVEAVSETPIEKRSAPRRPGDAPALVCDTRRIASTLDWKPKHDDLGHIVRTALQWERQLDGASQLARKDLA